MFHPELGSLQMLLDDSYQSGTLAEPGFYLCASRK
jgi:hypothetical protein